MILIDKDKKFRIEKKHEIITQNFKKANLNGVSYDLRIDKIYSDKKDVKSYELSPNEYVYVKTLEKLDIPYDLVGIIVERNSIMRQGLRVDGPRYQPGHKSFAFLRVQNISNKKITIENDMGIAQIYFEKLSGIPKKTYDKQDNSTFQDENEYIGLGSYTDEYKKKTEEIVKKAEEDIHSVADKIYGNVLVIVGIIFSAFSILTVNFQAFNKVEIDFKFLITLNLSLALSITVLFGLILLFIQGRKKKYPIIIYLGSLMVLVISMISLITYC